MSNRIKRLASTATIRAVKTFAQTLAAMLTAAGTGLLDTDWTTALSVSGMAALLSVLTTLGGDWITETKASYGNDESGAVSLDLIVGIVVGVVGLYLTLVLSGRI